MDTFFFPFHRDSSFQENSLDYCLVKTVAIIYFTASCLSTLIQSQVSFDFKDENVK